MVYILIYSAEQDSKAFFIVLAAEEPTGFGNETMTLGLKC